MKNKKYTTLNLPIQTIEEIRCLKIAYGYTTGSIVNYGDIITELIRGVEKTNPALYQTYLKIRARQDNEA